MRGTASVVTTTTVIASCGVYQDVRHHPAMLSLLATFLVFAVIAIWTWHTHLSPSAKLRRASAMAATAELRGGVLSRKFLLEAQSQEVLLQAFAMDWRISAGQLATLVVYDDGTTSLYLSSGGGIIGAGTVDTVKALAAQFLASFAGLESHLRVVDTWPPPEIGRFVFYMINRDATFATQSFSTKELRVGDHPLHSLEAVAQRLFTAIRTARPQKASAK